MYIKYHAYSINTVCIACSVIIWHYSKCSAELMKKKKLERKSQQNRTTSDRVISLLYICWVCLSVFILRTQHTKSIGCSFYASCLLMKSHRYTKQFTHNTNKNHFKLLERLASMVNSKRRAKQSEKKRIQKERKK